MEIKWEKHHLWIKVLLILLIPIAIYLGVTNSMLYDNSLYKEEFGKVGTYDRVPEADSIMDNMIDFFRGEEDIQANFTTAEKNHLEDVKGLITSVTGFLYLLILIKLALFGVIIFTSKKAIDDIIHITLGSGLLTFFWPFEIPSRMPIKYGSRTPLEFATVKNLS